MLRVGSLARRKNRDKRTVFVNLFPAAVELFDCFSVCRRDNRRRNSATHRREMRHKLQNNLFTRSRRELFLHFRKMTVPSESVCLRTFRPFAKEKIFGNFSPRSTHTAVRGDDNSPGRNNFSLHQRKKRNQNSSRITAGSSSERSRFPILRQLRQNINRTVEQIRIGMFFIVIFLIKFRRRKSKIGTQIDHFFPGFDKRPGKSGRNSMREREKKKIDALIRRETVRIGIDKSQIASLPAKRGNHLLQMLSRMPTRSDARQIDVRMLEQQLNQQFARITGCAYDANCRLCLCGSCLHIADGGRRIIWFRKTEKSLTLGELETLACARLTRFLALALARIALEMTVLFQNSPQFIVIFQQSA